ncbi:hypothetical protein HMI54_010381 [Coelomomyces lativittatus]|nr:hypothetical protein HMI56_005686 [Coelomomyces lativittatus]KAJ1516214.1 hypothetical protein HMI54_010381 [Coelomomyces lativittatus]KAJ1517151.1 hypothetical protein HMI55_000522 [Coelomomyces lativittatus]
MGVPRSHLLEKITKTLLTELQAVKRELKEGVMELSNTLISVTALRDEFEEKLLGMQTSLESMDEKVIEALTKYTESNLKWTPDEAFHDN